MACGRPRPTRDNRWVSAAAALATVARRLLARPDAGPLRRPLPASGRGNRRATVASAAAADTFGIEVGGPGVRVSRRLLRYGRRRGAPSGGASPRRRPSRASVAPPGRRAPQTPAPPRLRASALDLSRWAALGPPPSGAPPAPPIGPSLRGLARRSGGGCRGSDGARPLGQLTATMAAYDQSLSACNRRPLKINQTRVGYSPALREQ